MKFVETVFLYDHSHMFLRTEEVGFSLLRSKDQRVNVQRKIIIIADCRSIRSHPSRCEQSETVRQGLQLSLTRHKTCFRLMLYRNRT